MHARTRTPCRLLSEHFLLGFLGPLLHRGAPHSVATRGAGGVAIVQRVLSHAADSTYVCRG